MKYAYWILGAARAAAGCAAAGRNAREEYVVEYEAFLQLLEQRVQERGAPQTIGSSTTIGTPIAPVSSSESLYNSQNGDCWRLIQDAASGRQFVQHEANPSSGGQVTEMSVEDFLSQGGSGPEYAALRRVLDREAQSG